MPVHVIHGRKAGPCMFISGAIHGDEINGVEIVRRLIRIKALKRLRGTLLAVPVVNVHGFVQRTRYLPDRRDLNRFFPGSKEGSMAGHLASIFMEKIVKPSQFGIDLHTGSNFRANLPQIRAQLDDPETERMARAFKAPIILDAALRPGSLREAAEKEDATVIVYEAGEALRFNEWAVSIGVKGCLSVMREIGMLSPPAKPGRAKPSSMSRNSTWVRAPNSGVVQIIKKLGAHVVKGDCLGTVSDPFGENQSEILSPANGIIIGETVLPLAHRGEALLHIAEFKNPEATAERIELIRQDFDAEPDA